MDPISKIRLSLVAPQLAQLWGFAAGKLAAENIPTRVTWGLRTWAEQGVLYAQGRTTPGKVVTHAPPGHSWHEFGLAIDVVPMTLPQGQPDWNPAHAAWKRIVEVGEGVGLYSGTEFVSCPPDTPHFQLTGHFPASPNDEVRQLYKSLGMLAVWHAAGLDVEIKPVVISPPARIISPTSVVAAVRGKGAPSES